MWFIFDKIEERKGLKGRSGKEYDAFVVCGTKKGFQGEPDSPYEKTIFPNTPVTVIEKGVTRPNQSLVQYFQKACHPGDTIIITSEREGRFWRWAKVENRSTSNVLSYEPLTDEEAERIRKSQSVLMSENSNSATIEPSDSWNPPF